MRDQIVKALNKVTSRTFNRPIWTFREAKQKAEDAKGKKKLGNNMFLEKTKTGYGITHQNKLVIEFLEGDQYKLDTQGMKSNSVKEIFNEFTPAYLDGKPGAWVFSDGTPFADGVLVDSSGFPV